MDSSGLIVAFVVALWAAYFVPLVLRRYDESGKRSALDSEGPLRRVVKKSHVQDEVTESVHVAADSAPEVAAPKAAAAPTPEAAPAAAPRPAAPVVVNRVVVNRAAAALAARRRRRTLIALVLVLAVVSGVAAAGLINVWFVAAPVTLIVAWLVACRLMVRSERGISRQRKYSILSRIRVPAVKLPKRRVSRTVSRAAAPAADAEQTVIVAADDAEPEREHVMEEAPLNDADLDEQLQIAVPSVSVTGEALWDPLPVTVPTYVTKPRVGRTVRTIDFSGTGTWTSGHVEGENTDYPAARADRGDEGETRTAVGH